MSCNLLYDWRAYKRKVVERDSRRWMRAEVMRLQARRCQGDPQRACRGLAPALSASEWLSCPLQD